MNRAKRRRQSKDDGKRLARGIDPVSRDPEMTAAMGRQLHELFERAKRDRNINLPVEFLHAKMDATLRGLRDVPVACRKGCSHCCHIWVSVTAPEALFVAKVVRRRGVPLIARVRAAHLATAAYDFETRDQHPHPCPLLAEDICSIYDSRPSACRFAASADAAICARAYRDLSGENIPTPVVHMLGRSVYAVAVGIALKHATLPYHAYEFNAALARALEKDDAEQAWLGGEDIFADVMREPSDLFSAPQAHQMYDLAFGS
jgi:Putative zinc- or iron-chelating domain